MGEDTGFAVLAAATWSRHQKYYILRNLISLAKLETVANVRVNNSTAHLYSAVMSGHISAPVVAESLL